MKNIKFNTERKTVKYTKNSNIQLSNAKYKNNKI